jgi:hypothetical protein
MKKILLTALLCCATASVFAQGVVQFRNYWTSTTPAVNAPVGIQGGALLNASNPLWRAALIGGPVGATPTDGMMVLGNLSMMYYTVNTTVTWVNFRTGATPPAADGYINVGSSTARVVPGVDWGAQAVVQMVAWQGNFTTYADAWTAAQTDPTVLIGASSALTLQLPASSTDPNLTYLWGLNAFNIHPVPEPATLALAGLGAAALLIFRRRQ